MIPRTAVSLAEDRRVRGLAAASALSSRLVGGPSYALKLPVIDISESVPARRVHRAVRPQARTESGPLRRGPAAPRIPLPGYAWVAKITQITDANVAFPGFVSPRALAGGTGPRSTGNAPALRPAR